MLSHTVKDSVVTIRIQIKLRNKLRGSPSLSNKVNRKSTGGRSRTSIWPFRMSNHPLHQFSPIEMSHMKSYMNITITCPCWDSFLRIHIRLTGFPYNPRRSLYSLMKALLFPLNSVSYGLK